MLAVQKRRLLRLGVPACALEGGYVSVCRECVQREQAVPVHLICEKAESCMVQDTKRNARPLESRLTLAWGRAATGEKAANTLMITRRWKLKYLSWFTTCPRA